MQRERHIDRTVHQVTDYRGIERFLELPDVPAGILSIQSNGLPIDVLNHPANSKTTVVCFHGALEPGVKLPMLSGQGVTSGLPANRIFISDPSLCLDEDLPLAWYAGSEVQPDLQQDLAAIVRHIAESTGAENMIFFGVSGGGFAALQMAQDFPGSIAVPVNPQTNIKRYLPWAVQKYADIGWSGTLPDAKPFKDLDSPSPQEPLHTIAYVQNADDRFHIDHHLIPFVAESSDRLHLVMDGWAKGHTPPPKPYLANLLGSLVHHAPDWDGALHQQGFVRSPSKDHVQSLRNDGPLQTDMAWQG